MPAGGPVGKPDDTFESFFEYDSVRGSTENSSGSPAVREGLAGDRTHDLLDGVLERTSKVTGCFCLEEFRFVQTTVKHASLWIAVQGLLVLLLLLLYVYTLEPHINQVQSTLEKYCSDGHKWSEEAVCLGPSWKETLSATLLMHGQSREQSTQDWVITHDEVLEFDVASSPPTILVGVRPLGRCKGGVRWRLLIFDVARKFEETHTGAGSQSFVVSTTRAAASKWKVEFSLLKGVDQLGESEMCEIEIFAVDNQQPHLPRIHDKFSDSNGQCEFAGTWLRLADRHDLGWAQFAVSGINNFLWLRVVSFLVYTRGVSNSLAKVDYFSAAVLVKSFIIDISMQVLLVSYIYYWYGRNGLQCQMCLFHSNHCENFDADPMHGTLRSPAEIFAGLPAKTRNVLLGFDIDTPMSNDYWALPVVSKSLRGIPGIHGVYSDHISGQPLFSTDDQVVGNGDCAGLLQFVKPISSKSVVLMRNSHNPDTIGVITPQKRWVLTNDAKCGNAVDLSGEPVRI
ncbi:hypothetical protein FOZ61_008204 [Perkinsus olseni]|uniref:Uncharacterized protein n=1 Tax=Perkinsus olseni TaxID=32597 RepID=A0A7J6L5Q5_PEROL|nr:hypothetical protein FOZ61_008204 [Perkinsus olseni]